MANKTPKPSDLSEGLTTRSEAQEHHGRATLGDGRRDAPAGARRAGDGRRGDPEGRVRRLLTEDPITAITNTSSYYGLG